MALTLTDLTPGTLVWADDFLGGHTRLVVDVIDLDIKNGLPGIEAHAPTDEGICRVWRYLTQVTLGSSKPKDES